MITGSRPPQTSATSYHGILYGAATLQGLIYSIRAINGGGVTGGTRFLSQRDPSDPRGLMART
jgi:hypothetical protein